MQNTNKTVMSGLLSLWVGLSGCVSMNGNKDSEQAEYDHGKEKETFAVVEAPPLTPPLKEIVPPESGIRSIVPMLEQYDKGAGARPDQDIVTRSPTYPPELFTPPEISPPPGLIPGSDESIEGGICTDPVMVDTLVARSTYSEVSMEAVIGITDMRIGLETEDLKSYLLDKQERKRKLYEQVFSCNPENATVYNLAQGLLNEKPVNQDNFKALYMQVASLHSDAYEDRDPSVSFGLMLSAIIENKTQIQGMNGFNSEERRVELLQDVSQQMKAARNSFELLEIKRDLAEIFENETVAGEAQRNITMKIQGIVDAAIQRQEQKAHFQKIDYTL